MNTDPADLRRQTRSKYRAIEVLGLLVPRFIKARKPTPVDIQSDHPAVDVPVLLPRRRRMGATRNPWRNADA